MDTSGTKEPELWQTRSKRMKNLTPKHRQRFPKASNKPLDKLDDSTSATSEGQSTTLPISKGQLTNHPIQKSKRTKFLKEFSELREKFGSNKILLGQFETQTNKRGDPKNKILQGNCCSCNDWQLPGEHSSLNNFSFDKTDRSDGTTLLDFFKIFEFLNARFIHFNN